MCSSDLSVKEQVGDLVTKAKRRVGIEQPSAADEDGRVGVVRGALRTFGEGDTDGFLDTLREDVVWEGPAGGHFPGGGEQLGRDAVRTEFVENARRTFTNFGFKPESYIEAEDANAVEIGGSGTVLLVEDNPEVASVSAGLLEQLGYTVRRVANAEAALRELELDGIDLVFSDIVMPGKMDGLDLARHLKAVKPQLPILLASGYSDAALSVRGDFPILRKPYEIHELSQAIAKLPR